MMSPRTLSYLQALADRHSSPLERASESQIRTAELSLGMSFPPELHTWLESVNGTYLFFGVGNQRLTIVSYLNELKPAWKQKGWIPIARDSGSGTYLLVTNGNYSGMRPIAFIDIFNSQSLGCIMSSSLEIFVETFIEKEYRMTCVPGVEDYMSSGFADWPFRKDFALSRDPDLALFPQELLPWNN